VQFDQNFSGSDFSQECFEGSGKGSAQLILAAIAQTDPNYRRFASAQGGQNTEIFILGYNNKAVL
jgi:hypothetical protein